ncbi:MAG: exodeoxyribonuclease VII large subunit [Phycisphaerales bacterium]
MTGRLPFNPKQTVAAQDAAAKKTAAPETATAAPTGTATTPANLTVSQLAAMIGDAVQGVTKQSIRVVGEIGNFTDRTHWYFTIKDAEAVVSCVMFAGAARKHSAGFVPQPGQQVVVTGKLDFYKPQGKVTLIVERIEPVGQGALEIAFRKLCEDLRALGWFAIERKRELPVFPRRIAIVTSRTGAALQDVIDTARRRCPAVEICLIDTLVQGAGAAPGVAAAVNWVSRHAARLNIDALLVTRGGGSMEDLWAFNERIVAEAIVHCSVPVVAAIGHETDTTIAELVADLRAATPTQAVMHLTPDREAMTEQLAATQSRLATLVKRGARERNMHLAALVKHLGAAGATSAARLRRRLDSASARLERHRPTAIYAQRRAALERAAQELHDSMKARLDREPIDRVAADLARAVQIAGDRRAEQLAAMQRQLDLVGPIGVLRRGFSVTLNAAGEAVRQPSDAQPGEAITTRLADGTIRSVVQGRSDEALPPPTRLAPRAKGFGRRKRTDDSTPRLFE